MVVTRNAGNRTSALQPNPQDLAARRQDATTIQALLAKCTALYKQNQELQDLAIKVGIAGLVGMGVVYLGTSAVALPAILGAAKSSWGYLAGFFSSTTPPISPDCVAGYISNGSHCIPQ